MSRPSSLRLSRMAVYASVVFTWSAMAQDGPNIIRLQCEGVEKTSQSGFNATPETRSQVSPSLVINSESGVATDNGLTTITQVLTTNASPHYVFTVTDDAFLWTGKARSPSDPVTSTASIRIDRFSGALTLLETMISGIAGKEYINTRQIDARCRRVTTRQF